MQSEDVQIPATAHASHWAQALAKGTDLLIVGGAEDRLRQKTILRKFVELAGGKDAKILVISIASETPEIIYEAYHHAFNKIGVSEVRGLLTTSRDDLRDIDAAKLLDGITGIYFSGGDQLRISTMLGGTQFFFIMEQMVRSGVTLGGTSAGASAISDTMIIDWEPSDQPVAHNIRLSSGLGILRHMVIDQHFTERNRLNRLITAVAYHPGYLGIGIDEDTAIHVSPDGILSVIGSGTVTIVDGSDISECNIAEVRSHQPFSIVGLKMHVLAVDSAYNLNHRRPLDSH